MKNIYKIIALSLIVFLVFLPPPAEAATTVLITSGTSWAGATTDGSNITVECIGGGSYGGTSTQNGGGGEYRKASLPYTSGSTVNNIQIGQGGAGRA